MAMDRIARYLPTYWRDTDNDIARYFAAFVESRLCDYANTPSRFFIGVEDCSAPLDKDTASRILKNFGAREEAELIMTHSPRDSWSWKDVQGIVLNRSWQRTALGLEELLKLLLLEEGDEITIDCVNAPDELKINVCLANLGRFEVWGLEERNNNGAIQRWAAFEEFTLRNLPLQIGSVLFAYAYHPAPDGVKLDRDRVGVLL